LTVGGTQQFVATGHYSDSSTSDLSLLVAWGSETPGTATINGTGLASAVGPGTSIITATKDLIVGQTLLTSNAIPVVLSGHVPTINTVHFWRLNEETGSATCIDEIGTAPLATAVGTPSSTVGYLNACRQFNQPYTNNIAYGVPRVEGWMTGAASGADVSTILAGGWTLGFMIKSNYSYRTGQSAYFLRLGHTSTDISTDEINQNSYLSLHLFTSNISDGGGLWHSGIYSIGMQLGPCSVQGPVGSVLNGSVWNKFIIVCQPFSGGIPGGLDFYTNGVLTLNYTYGDLNPPPYTTPTLVNPLWIFGGGCNDLITASGQYSAGSVSLDEVWLENIAWDAGQVAAETALY
jgi:hypothetical protein